jgi:hypothetical protein
LPWTGTILLPQPTTNSRSSEIARRWANMIASGRGRMADVGESSAFEERRLEFYTFSAVERLSRGDFAGHELGKPSP